MLYRLDTTMLLSPFTFQLPFTSNKSIAHPIIIFFLTVSPDASWFTAQAN